MEQNPDLSSATGFDFTMLSTLNITSEKSKMNKTRGTSLSDAKARITNTLLQDNGIIGGPGNYNGSFMKKVNPLHQTFKNPLKKQYNLNNINSQMGDINIAKFASNTSRNVLDKDLWGNNDSQNVKNEEVAFAQKLLFTKDPTLLDDGSNFGTVNSFNVSRRRGKTNLNGEKRNGNVKIKPVAPGLKEIPMPSPRQFESRRSSSMAVKKEEKKEGIMSIGNMIKRTPRKPSIRQNSPLIKPQKPEIISSMPRIHKIEKVSTNLNNFKTALSIKIDESPETVNMKYKTRASRRSESEDQKKDDDSQEDSRYSRRFIFEEDDEEVERIKGARLVGSKHGGSNSKAAGLIKSQELRFFTSRSPNRMPDRLSAGNNPLHNTFKTDRGDKSFKFTKPPLQKKDQDRSVERKGKELEAVQRQFEAKEKELSQRIKDLEFKNQQLYDKKVEAEEKLRQNQKERLLDLNKMSNKKNDKIEEMEEEAKELKEQVQKLDHTNRVYKNRIDFLEKKRFDTDKQEGLVSELQERVMTLESLKVELKIWLIIFLNFLLIFFL